MSELISVTEANRLLMEHVQPTPSVRCPLNKAAGRVLREDITADRDLPPYDRCMLDGYAVRANEVKEGSIFTIHARIHAGEPTQVLEQSPLAAVEVMTGSMLPAGANAVVRYEDTKRLDAQTFSYKDKDLVEAEDGVHRQASDYPKGTVLLRKGAQLGPVEIGIAASCGIANPLCAQLPRITIFGTGDELVPVNETPAPHQIRQSNLHVIENALANAGFHAGQVALLSDDRDTEEAKLAQAIQESDVIVISGAVSKGKRDWIPDALTKMSRKHFHGVRQRPGKPMGFWKAADGPAIFGLPGNPVATLITTHRYVLPYLWKCLGGSQARHPAASLGEVFTFSRPMTLFMPFSYGPNGLAELRPLHNSGDYARLVGTDGFLEFSEEHHTWPVGAILPLTLWQR